MQELVGAIQEEAGITPAASNKFGYKEIIFHNRQRIGDMFMYTCAVRDFKKAFPEVKINVLSTAMHIWDNNPYIDKTLKPFYKEGKTLENITPADFLNGSTNVLKIGPGKLTNMSNRIDWHFANAFRVSIEDAIKIHIPQGESRGDVWLTDEEYNAPRVFDKPYWLIVTGGERGWGCKMYPSDRWQEFVEQNPDKLFVQLGAKSDDHVRLKGFNVIDYVGKTEDKNTGLRDLLKLFINAEGSIGLVSFHMHLSGALYKPAVVVAGAREPVSFTKYHGHQYLANDGCLPCGINACWHCDINACKDLITIKNERVPRCVDMIKAEDLTRAINQYYIGGRLKIGVPSDKPKQFKNIVKVPKFSAASDKIMNTQNEDINHKKNLCPTGCGKIPVATEKNPMSKYGLIFGSTCIEKEDWAVIEEVIKKNNVKRVLEFGSGLSTLLMADMGLEVISYEVMDEWAKKIRDLNPKVDIRPWDGKEIPGYKSLGEFDLVFCDGPASSVSAGEARKDSIKMSADLARILIVHDGGRAGEAKWQDMFVKDKFEGPVKGGRRCHTWIRKGLKVPDLPSLEPVVATIRPQASKSIKFISTARGWGGCARSITTIMQLLLEGGHKVEFIPFRNQIGSREMLDCIKNNLKGLKVTLDYQSLHEQCDILVVYGDDYIWDFEKPEIVEAFSALNADKKIMVLNYRRGPVGQVEWTRNWDKYMFLNSTQEAELLKVNPGVKTKVLAPCTDLKEFFAVKPDYSGHLRIVRHNSQGDTKFAKDFNKELAKVLERPDVEVMMMPGPSFVEAQGRFQKFPKNMPPIPQFLEKGNLFWYSLPSGYMDMGPRVILEAMAAGLPVIADNWGGAVDRVTPETGWICSSKEEMVEIIKNVKLEELKAKGEAARERALKEFIPEKWVEEILE